MLDKILAGNSHDPSYLMDLKWFAKTASREKLVRGLGLFFIIMAMFIQLSSAIIPNKVAATPSQNDLIPGGVSSKSEMVSDCRANTNHIDKILDFYGISCADMAKGDVVSLNSRDYNDRLHSVGHLAYGFASETPVNIGNETVYWRLLHAWDTGNSSTYSALKFQNAAGKTFWALFTCGNLVHVGVPNPFHPPPPPPPPPPPKQPCPYNSAILASNPACKPCTASNSQVDALACLIYHKTVSDKKRGITDANGTTANAGDELTYSLIVSNAGKLAAKDFVIQDNIADILDYAKLTNPGGGTLSSNGLLSFPKTTIAVGATVTKTFTVTVKNPVPTTAASNNNPLGFDDTMTNVYGDIINVKVQPPTSQVVVTTATTLPNTGPGMSTFIYAAIAAIAGYLFYNRRLQLKEAKIAIDLAHYPKEA